MLANLAEQSRGLTTAHVADACVRTSTPAAAAAPGLRAILPGPMVAGPARPVRHSGSVDVFLESLETARRGDVLVIDNGARDDEACVGDLVAIEAQRAGLGGMVVNGLHRDTEEIRRLAFPVWSLGSLPFGPRRANPRPPDTFESAFVGDVCVTARDVVFADEDGVLFVPADAVAKVVPAAAAIAAKERAQADRARAGATLRVQLAFAEYLERRRRDPKYSFRDHVASLGGAVET